MSRSIELISEMIVDSFAVVLGTQKFDAGECSHFCESAKAPSGNGTVMKLGAIKNRQFTHLTPEQTMLLAQDL